MRLPRLLHCVQRILVEHSEFIDESRTHMHDKIKVADPFENETVEESDQFLERAKSTSVIPYLVASLVLVEIEDCSELRGMTDTDSIGG